MNPDLDLSIRYHVYQFFVEQDRPPSCQEIASLMKLESSAVRAAYQRLHQRHMIFLEPGTDAIRFANPFSGLPTLYRVRSKARGWWANCAWDMLGIAAALNIDVEIEAGYPDGSEPAVLRVENGQVDGK